MWEQSSVQRTNDLLNLSQLLNNDENISEDDQPDSGPAFTPASIGITKKDDKPVTKSPYVKTQADSDSIWDENQVEEISVYTDDGDSRPIPEYDISYKQKVTSEDMFLGISGKNPSSACCEEMILKIKLPDTKIEEVNLEVKETHLTCQSPKYRLLLPFPHPVHPKQGSAKWNKNTESLEVTLALNREYDFINFQ